MDGIADWIGSSRCVLTLGSDRSTRVVYKQTEDVASPTAAAGDVRPTRVDGDDAVRRAEADARSDGYVCRCVIAERVDNSHGIDNARCAAGSVLTRVGIDRPARVVDGQRVYEACFATAGANERLRTKRRDGRCRRADADVGTDIDGA